MAVVLKDGCVVRLAWVSPFTKPVKVAVNVGLAEPYIFDVFTAVTVKPRTEVEVDDVSRSEFA